MRAGVKAWWQCRTAELAMWALAKSGVKFRTLVNDDGSHRRWQQPALEEWERTKNRSARAAATAAGLLGAEGGGGDGGERSGSSA